MAGKLFAYVARLRMKWEPTIFALQENWKDGEMDDTKDKDAKPEELSDESLDEAEGGFIMGTVYGVMKESIKETNEDLNYWKKKLS